METAKNEKKRNYYLEGVKLYLEPNETVENYLTLLDEYEQAYKNRKAAIDKLYDEIKQIKKMKV